MNLRFDTGAVKGLVKQQTRSVVCAVLFSLTAAGSGLTQALSVGDAAPEYALQGSDGQTHTLADHRGKRAVVIAWYPKAFTSGCTIECKSLKEDGHRIREFDVAYYMASTDGIADATRFARQQDADFPILADPDGAAAREFGVLRRGGYAARETIYIDIDGNVSFIDRRIKPASAAGDIARRLKKLKVAKAPEEPGVEPGAGENDAPIAL